MEYCLPAIKCTNNGTNNCKWDRVSISLEMEENSDTHYNTMISKPVMPVWSIYRNAECRGKGMLSKQSKEETAE